jgi:transcriptional regulator GlxA family with amidase domain
MKILWTAIICVAAITAAAQTPEKLPTFKVAVVVHEGVEILDFAGPMEVFDAVPGKGASQSDRWFETYTVAPRAENISSNGKSLIVRPTYSIENCPQPDILVVPGGNTRVLVDDPAFMKWVKETMPKTKITMSVCTGAFVLAGVGALDGEKATTHRGALMYLKQRFPKIDVRGDVRIVDNGKIVTCAGVSAGIDGALHLVARLIGRALADEAVERMEYDWRPAAELAKSYSDLNPQMDELGRAKQAAAQLMVQGKTDEAIAAYRAICAKAPEDAEANFSLGRVLHDKKSWDEAIKYARLAEKDAVFGSKAIYNIACASALLGKKDAAFAELTRAIESGFYDLEWIKDDEDLISLRDDPRWKEILLLVEKKRAAKKAKI